MGGLDARYLISNLEGNKIISSLITIGTPHRGSAYADWFIKNIGDRIYLENLLNILPFESGAHKNLTTKWVQEEFNPSNQDHPDVKYYSLAGVKEIPLTHILYIPHRIITNSEGINDGLVSVESAKWGEFLGVIPLDHAEQINWSKNYDARILYRNIVNFITEKGF